MDGKNRAWRHAWNSNFQTEKKVAIRLITVVGGGLRRASLCPAMWLLTGVARWKLYLFIVAGCNNPGDTWEIFTAIKISKKNFMGVICVRPMDAVHSFRISRPVYTSRFQRWGGKKRFARARCSFLRRRGNDASSLLQRRVFENVNLWPFHRWDLEGSVFFCRSNKQETVAERSRWFLWTRWTVKTFCLAVVCLLEEIVSKRNLG